ncbi:MAG: PAS domain S-box protein, partial [Gemmatimonadota bacterium]
MVEPQLLDPSSYGHSPLALPIGAVAVASLCVGLWVVAHERARRVSLSLLVTTAMLAMYLGGFAVMVSASRPDVALFWGKAAYLGVPFIVPAIYQFSMDLLGLGRQRRRLIRAAWGVGLLYMVLAVGTDLLVPGVLRMEWGYVTRITAWHLPFILVSLGVLGLTGRDYARQYRAAAGTQRARIRWFAIPIVIASLAFIDYGASLGLPVAPWGFVFFAVFLASAAAAVARYHLPDLTPAFAADQIVRTMAEPLLVCDAAGVIAFANPAAERLLGWPAGELVGQPLHTLFGLARARALLEGEPRTGLELEIMSRTGELVAVAVSTNWIQATGGRNVGLVVVARDIRERHRSAQALERREQYFRALIEHARDTITILDGEGRITYDSPAARELLGQGAASAVGSSMGDRLHPEDRGGMLEMFEELMERPGGVADAECRVRDSSGGYRVMELRATNLLAHPAVGGVVVNGRDVTEERHLSEQLQHAQRMEAVGRLAGGVAHDFNNILTAIQGNVAILRDELSGRGPCPEELQEIQRGADRAGRLTDQLLAFSRRQVVRPEPLDLNALVADLRSMLERLIGEGIRLETRTAPDLGLVHADRGHLEQVIMNLAVNARDALEGAGRLQISTENASID